MTDLLDQFADLLKQYEAYRDSEDYFEMYNTAGKLCDLLLKHGPTVTFTAPAEPSAAADTHDTFERHVDRNGRGIGWLPKRTVPDGGEKWDAELRVWRPIVDDDDGC